MIETRDLSLEEIVKALPPLHKAVELMDRKLRGMK